MKKDFPAEFIFQVFSLFIAAIIVHAIYVVSIRPNAEAFREQQAVELQSNETYVAEQSLYVIVHDYEQETCFILMLWAFAIMAYKGIAVFMQRKLLREDLVPISEGMRILPEDTRSISRQIQSLPAKEQNYLLPRALLAGLHRFDSTQNVQDVSTSTRDVCESEGERLESELSMIRYIAWAIPSVGFIGTVRGIGQALGQAHKAVEGDITGVTQSLGVAFNSTLVALVISIFLMFLVHQLQLAQERLVLDAEDYCDYRLTRHLQVR